MLKAQNYSLVKTYFHKLKSLTHGKHKLLMIYYSSFKATKFMGTMPKPIYITHGKIIHFVGMNKPREAQQQGPTKTAQTMC